MNNYFQSIPEDLIFYEIIPHLPELSIINLLEILHPKSVIRYLYKFRPKIMDTFKKAKVPRNRFCDVLYYNYMFEKKRDEHYIKVNEAWSCNCSDPSWRYYDYLVTISPEMYALQQLDNDTYFDPYYFYHVKLFEYSMLGKLEAMEQVGSSEILLMGIYTFLNFYKEYHTEDETDDDYTGLLSIINKYIQKNKYEYIRPDEYIKLIQLNQYIYWILYLHYLESLVRGFNEPSRSFTDEFVKDIMPKYKLNIIEILMNPLILGKLEF